MPALTSRVHRDLPVFRLDDGDAAVFYAPGEPIAVTRDEAQEVERALAGHDTSANATAVAAALQARARAARQAWTEWGSRPFEPECLTLYLSNQCNLACTYCYAVPPDAGAAALRLHLTRETAREPAFPILGEATIAAAARLVARHCAAKHKPLTLVLHGGGEPTMHWDLLGRVWSACQRIATAEGLSLWSYIATHGVLAEERVRWLARHFNLIGLSCDGPPDIQNANRPSSAQTATSASVERTARVLHEEAADYVVRCTVTARSSHRQIELVEYFCDRLLATNLRFEPVYSARRAPGEAFSPDDAAGFVARFVEAQRVARARGCELELSGVRIDELHGPYCNPSREVLQLMPDGRASACFLSAGNNERADAPMVMGRIDPASQEFVVDRGRVERLRAQAARIPARCESCHNIYHCARDCPDVCYLADAASDAVEGFRCRVQQLIGRHDILRAAART
jgi:uncharacterized protein